MLDVRVAGRLPRGVAVVALPVGPGTEDNDPDAAAVATHEGDSPSVELLVDVPHGVDAEELVGFLDESEHSGKAGSTQTWIRPLQRLARLVFVGVGDGGEAAWRSAGAALARTAKKEEAVALVLPDGVGAEAVRGLAEGLWLASYRYRLGNDDDKPALRRVTLVSGAPFDEALAKARITVTQIRLARDLTNTPSDRKTPDWFAKQVIREAKGVADLTVTVREPAQLSTEGFGGILAVGSGSAHGPRLVELAYRPRGAKLHVVLVGKGITFDTGGICIKGRDGMKLMRKDMGGAAAVVAATLGAANLRLPVRVTALAPLAENMVSGTAMRPGDVVRHFGGITSEVRNTDAEGRLVLADALAYGSTRLKPDYLIDLATLTGAQSVALGKRTAALFSDSDALAKELATAADEAGEKVWRLPLPEDYVEALAGDDTDLINATEIGAGSVTAALYLREFAGVHRDRWAHIDMSAPAWADGADGELVKGATGWGVRTLLRWLSTLTP
ncbi:leucyl aminopeptidase [Virgisporangium aliadipatigenens]|uniref:Probable cytosol aminopeptidase n=1 Tax=Virgisporangium aliadipatigenens TaxID=741659 RepID=A0A8J4DSV1_9ACTN|nr:leucyl aminopeptidase family protein [Virgisporangium aliadipatigenens]GIJ48536.1 leucyl aminopeptidase [Virgisporangium aliadipatigenens]